MRTVFSSLVLVLAFTFVDASAFAQRETATGVDIHRDLQLLRRDLRANKKKLIALNLNLTEEEATKFWPVYDQYAAEMAKLNDEFYALINGLCRESKDHDRCPGKRDDQEMGRHPGPPGPDTAEVHSAR